MFHSSYFDSLPVKGINSNLLIFTSSGGFMALIINSLNSGYSLFIQKHTPFCY